MSDQDADPEQVARLIVLQRLGTSARTRAELADTLRRRLVPDDVANRVLDRFTELGYIDDSAFAVAWVQSRHTGRGLARRALRTELIRKGVGQEDIDQALTTIDDDREYAQALQLAERRVRAGLSPDQQRRRIHGLLARRGYPSAVCSRVARQIVGREQEAFDQ